MKKNFVVTLTVLFFVSACGILDKRSSNLNIDYIKHLDLSDFDQDSAIKHFGPPDKRISSVGSENQIYWHYLVEPFKALPRLALSFDVESEKLTELVWQVRDGEPQSRLATAKKTFPQSDFVKLPRESPKTHYIPDEVFFVDRDAGVEILYRETPRRVDYITWKTRQIRNAAKSNKN